MESILVSIKKLLGVSEDYTHFDAELIVHINSVFLTLTQLGVGPAEGFMIRDEDDYWSDFMEDCAKLQAVKTYTHHRVRLMWDPPASSAHIEAMNRTIAELEWRLTVAVD